MPAEGAMESLCHQLASFHISARLQRVVEEDASSRNEYLTAEHQSLTSLQHPPPPPPTMATKRRLPSPGPGQRPSWEPPILDYSWFETLLEAGKEMSANEGNKDIAWRTDVMDNLVEQGLLLRYTNYLEDEWRKSPGISYTSDFLRDLFYEVHEDLREVSYFELIGIMKKHQRQSQDWEGMKHALLSTARKKDASFGDIALGTQMFTELEREMRSALPRIHPQVHAPTRVKLDSK